MLYTHGAFMLRTHGAFMLCRATAMICAGGWEGGRAQHWCQKCHHLGEPLIHAV